LKSQKEKEYMTGAKKKKHVRRRGRGSKFCEPVLEKRQRKRVRKKRQVFKG